MSSEERYEVFIFSSPHVTHCRWEVYDSNGRLIRSVKAKDPDEARATATQYLARLEGTDEAGRVPR
jgi:hypothetical protein